MQRIKRKSDFSSSDEVKINDAVGDVRKILADVLKAASVESLRGYEGNAARCYFSVFGKNITPEWADFPCRSKKTPKSNVNTVLSFLYTLLMYRVESAIEAHGLDVCCGNLLALNYGKSALVYDLMEEFRSPIADALCCSLFNLGTLKNEDFEIQMFDSDAEDFSLNDQDDGKGKTINTEKNAVLLTKNGMKKVIAAFEEKIDSLILYVPAGEKISYKKIIYEQAAHYKRVVTGEENEYKAYYFK